MKDIYKDILVSFYFYDESIESKYLIRFLSSIILSSGTKANKNKLYKALCVLNVALLRATYAGPHIYAYRSMGAKAFTGEIVGFRPFTNAVNGMVGIR